MGTTLWLLCLCVARVWCQSTTTTSPATPTITRLQPPNVNDVFVKERTETMLKLQWDPVSSDPAYNYTLQYSNGTHIANIAGTAGGPVTYTVSNLTAGTKYDFTLFTVFEDVNSFGHNFSASTRPLSVDDVIVKECTETMLKLQWDPVSSDPAYNYTLQYSNGTHIANIAGTAGGPVTYTVSNLTAGTKYDFTLFTVFEDVTSFGHNFSASTRPLSVDEVIVKERTETMLKLQWDPVSSDPAYNYTLQYSNGTHIANIAGTAGGPVTFTVLNLTAGTEYDLTLFTVFEDVTSFGHNFSASTRPLSVDEVIVKERTETMLKLQWDPVSSDPAYNYTLQYSNGTHIANIRGTVGGPVTFTVLNLIAGTKYDFTLFTVFMDVNSVGQNFSASTRPLNVDGVTAQERNETMLKLQWDPVSSDPAYNYTLQYSNGTHIANIRGTGRGSVTYTVLNLALGTVYNFTLFTVFDNVQSTGNSFSAVTTIQCSEWSITNTSFQAEIFGKFSSANATNGSTSVNGRVENRMVSFTGLYPGSTYTVSLYILLNLVSLKQCGHTLTIVPPQVTGLHCGYESGGYAFSLSWEPPQGVWTQVQVEISGRSPHNVTGTQLDTVIKDVKPAQTYYMTVTSVSGTMKSKPVSFECTTDPRGVIAGSVIGVLLLAVLVFLVIFILRRKPELLRPKYFVESQVANKTQNAIPIGNFEAHFNKMSRDQNRGFSEEYEDFSTVGSEQVCKAALISQNKAKNRFTNVLPYDWSRVKLTTIDDDCCSDYINASYIPGYGKNARQYIAAQGPLPSTVNDFWRMIWEQRAHSVVMVTNCREGERVKCEQYWPLDYTPCTYGNILVRVSSEKKEVNWTLREFVVTNTSTSEVRSVQHFHFTAWPDHGVPDGTTALMQFRGLVRQHIECCGSAGPTVVHCSAGVGRTGTLIALDVMLQQLEKEQKVGLAAYVHKMRLSRPLMVQTESQYIFLHQCILDSLKPKLGKIQEEPLYQNVDMIYVNSTALNEFHSANQNG
ncbi:receptor-type tyrosine-protein phosphatase H-like isoform X3 [Anguilla rostrata]|uniref:receptor-type tyrosine-protein phosphatase H-like isoform X3 n=1 Tax=Anguilla rostrata TaxID=7938 RepID=UPI0030D0613E